MKDEIIRGTALNNEVRFFAAYTKETVEEARRIHKLTPVTTAALGRALTAAAMMGAMCKNDKEVLTLILEGDGPAKRVSVTGDAKSNVKGLVYQPSVILPLKENGHLDVGKAIGHNGTLTLIRDSGMGEPYVGQTPLVSGEVAEDLTYYFAASEQIPTSVGLGVLVGSDGEDRPVKHAGGFIIQLMPDAADKTIDYLENSLKGISTITDYFEAGKDLDRIMVEILGPDLRIDERRPTRYHCNCSRERVTKALIAVGKNEIEDMIKDNEPVTLHCEFCKKDYTFSIEDLKNILHNTY
ncbi:MAG: Hsp33 family molecular chaperone HslO [Lachnospiraceae bacterium]|jgi:molecular chaperone Hsp33|nr:Hsp33 family molecular chaperone HslO [Lachnospiraceae bacterium]MEE3460831.1 Hsp33 family molecular chaperone HslO [Lachnospiraceae bacterium]